MSAAGVSIKVAIRCRPFSQADRLGVKMRAVSEEEGEVELINCDYSTTRFPFSYCWWSAYGYKRYCNEKDMVAAEAMELVNQSIVYNSCGQKIKDDLYNGSAVVLFAYGLSGSGKTFTVFGPDAIDAPEAWYKHAEPQELWGLFPRLAYDVFLDKKDNWKISLKYFQNVVDTVRDLMSSACEEQHYKNGMRKDPDGFMNIEWCSTKVISSWEDLRKTFTSANARKAIAPTQFNPMSTRGHCIMVLEVEMPIPDNEGMKQRGRVYVCDLAGTEPAGDIVFAQYNKVNFEDGTFEYKFTGAHPDGKKTKELQEQGKKINLSLSEMAQFFMKMAEAVMKKKMTPGMSIPGCNSFFLCKYLKDTMLQARTYLFCAIRPEVEFLKYTFSTLGFAKNASVIKLAPKKAGATVMSATEKRLMDELAQMRNLVEMLQAQAANSGDPNAAKKIAELQEMLAKKQADLMAEISGQEKSGDSEMELRQKEEYGKRGISLVAFEQKDNADPYFINIDEDSFRSHRFMYIIRKESVTFGSRGDRDIQLMSLSVLKDHCSVRFDGGKTVSIVGGKGDVWLNGKPIKDGQVQPLALFDRIAMGDQLMMFRWSRQEEAAASANIHEMTAEEAVNEYQEGMASFRNNNSGSGMSHELEEERRKLMEERQKWESEKQGGAGKQGGGGGDEVYRRAMLAVDKDIIDFLQKTKEAKSTVDLMNRVTMVFDVALEKGADHVPKVKIQVENSNPKMSILIEPAEFISKLALMKDELMRLRNAIEGRRGYELPERHDPLYLMFDNYFLLGSSTFFPELLIYNMETEKDERMNEIKNAVVPYNTIGMLDIHWKPLASEFDDGTKPVREVLEKDDLLGKPWTYRVTIKGAVDLPIYCEIAYVSYEFFGEVFTTEAVQNSTFSPVFDYQRVHHVPHVTKEFLDYLGEAQVELQIHVTQHIDPPQDRIGTSNTIVVDSIVTGEPQGYKFVKAADPKLEQELKNQRLQDSLKKAQGENSALKGRIAELEALMKSVAENMTITDDMTGGSSSKESKMGESKNDNKNILLDKLSKSRQLILEAIKLDNSIYDIDLDI